MDLEQALSNTVIAFKLMSYSYSLAGFFKKEFETINGEYIIPFSFILKFKRQVFPLIRDTCDYVFPFTKQCDGHQFLDFIQSLYEFQQHAVLEKKCFYIDFCFYNFRFENDNGKQKIVGWCFNFYRTKDLSRYTFSQRAQFLD